MALTPEDIQLYGNRAQTKMMEISEVIEDGLRRGVSNDELLAQFMNLYSVQRALFDQYNEWTDEEKERVITFMTDYYNLVEVPYTDYDEYVFPIVVPEDTANGDYVTQSQLAITVNILNTRMDGLESRIEDLENFDYSSIIPQELLDQVQENTDGIASLDEDLDELIDIVAGIETDLTNHINDNDRHITPTERTNWNDKVDTSTFNSAMSGKANTTHTHNISDVNGLMDALNSLATDISNVSDGEDGQDGVTPAISVGTVTVGADETASVEVDPGSTEENVIFNFVIPQGPQGEGFEIDAQGPLSGKSAYDAEEVGFTYLATDTGDYYILTETGWSDPIQFTGENGWSPKLGVYYVSDSKVVFELLDWIGGSGDKPTMPYPIGIPPEEVRFFLGASGFVTDPNLAVNVQGNIGPDGPMGERFYINAQGTDRSVYDEQSKGFTYLDETTGEVSFKLTDDSADWSDEFQWTGPAGPPASAWADLVADTEVNGNGFVFEMNGLSQFIISDDESDLWLNGDQTWKLGNADMAVEADAGHMVRLRGLHAGVSIEASNIDEEYSDSHTQHSDDDVTKREMFSTLIRDTVDDGSDAGQVLISASNVQATVNGEGVNVTDSGTSITKNFNSVNVSGDNIDIVADKLGLSGQYGIAGQFMKTNGESSPSWEWAGQKFLIEKTAHGFTPFDVLGITESGELEPFTPGDNEYVGLVYDVIDVDNYILISGGFIEDSGIDEGEFWYAQGSGLIDPGTPTDTIVIVGIAPGVGMLKPALGGNGSGGSSGLGDVLGISNDADNNQIINLADGTSDDHAVNVGQMDDAIESSIASSAALLRQNLGLTAHGFSVGDCLTLVGTDYEVISDPDTQPLVGIVIAVADANNFELQLGGWSAHLNLAAGHYYVQSDGTLDTVVTPLFGYISMGPFWGYIPARVPMSAGGGMPAREVYAFNSTLFTEDSKIFRGAISSLSGYTSGALSGVTFEVRLDSSGSWTSQANIGAVETWISSNVSGDATSGTKFWIKVLATYSGSGLAQYVMTYTA